MLCILQEFYFIRQKKGGFKGKLYQSYQNRSRKIRKGLPAIVEEVKEYTSLDQNEGNKDDQLNEGEEVRCKLKMMNDNFDDVKDLWVLSAKYRRSMLPKGGKNVTSFLDSWPNYKSSFGFKLVSSIVIVFYD